MDLEEDLEDRYAECLDAIIDGEEAYFSEHPEYGLGSMRVGERKQRAVFIWADVGTCRAYVQEFPGVAPVHLTLDALLEEFLPELAEDDCFVAPHPHREAGVVYRDPGEVAHQLRLGRAAKRAMLGGATPEDHALLADAAPRASADVRRRGLLARLLGR